jgi:hydroxymethylbilane synthase
VKIRLATRGSRLALIQAQLAGEALGSRYPEHDFVPVPMTTHGDRRPQMNLQAAAREGVFVKELEQALLDGRAELAVHSAKDLPTALTPGLVLAAFLPRADARDAIVAQQPTTLAQLPAGARIGTGSPRRAAQIRATRPDLRTVAIRGNVDTRLRRLAEGAVDAVILAAAGLERLGRLAEAHQLLPFDVMLPAPGQGALVIQAVEDSIAAQLASAIDDPNTRRAVEAERSLLRRLGGGCLSAVGAYASIEANELLLDAVVLADDASGAIRARARGRDDGGVLEEIIQRLEAGGAARLLGSAANPRRRAPTEAAGSSSGELAGLRIMVTRADRQAAALSRALESRGAVAVECPVITIEPIALSPLALAELDRYDWIVFSSANGVDRLLQELGATGREIPTHIKVAAIGPKTAARLREHGIKPALVPDEFVAEALADALAAEMDRGGWGAGQRPRVLLPRAAGSREVLPERLRAFGAEVTVLETYRVISPPDLRPRLANSLAGVDLVTLTSSSAVRHFVAALDAPLPQRIAVACIGPITAQTARELGIAVDIIAQEYTTRGLVEAIVRSRAPVSP